MTNETGQLRHSHELELRENRDFPPDMKLAGVTGLESATQSQIAEENHNKQTPPSQLASQDLGIQPDLQEIIDSWPNLSPELRLAVVAIVKSAKQSENAEPGSGKPS